MRIVAASIGDSRNSGSIVLQVTYGGVRMLFTGIFVGFEVIEKAMLRVQRQISYKRVEQDA